MNERAQFEHHRIRMSADIAAMLGASRCPNVDRPEQFDGYHFYSATPGRSGAQCDELLIKDRDGVFWRWVNLGKA